MHRENARQIGKATKRSRFGEGNSLQDRGTEDATKFCVQTGLDFHLIDAEWQQNYMSPTELDRNLSLLTETGSELRFIVTINARHLTAYDLTKEYSEVIAGCPNAGFCFVAGNPSYLSEAEQRLDASTRLAELVETTRNRLPFAPIFVGSEGLTDLTSRLSREFAAIPFILLDSAVLDKMAGFCSGPMETLGGVYCPCYLSGDEDGKLIKAFGGYALRRGWVRRALRHRGLRVAEVKSQLLNGGLIESEASVVLRNAIQELALCGAYCAKQRLRIFSGFGIRYVALLFAEDSMEEGKELERVVSQLN
jgi:hypothetical protein